MLFRLLEDFKSYANYNKIRELDAPSWTVVGEHQVVLC